VRDGKDRKVLLPGFGKRDEAVAIIGLSDLQCTQMAYMSCGVAGVVLASQNERKATFMDVIDYACRVGPLGRYLRLENNFDLESAAHLFGRQWAEGQYELADDFEDGDNPDPELAEMMREGVKRVAALAAHPDVTLAQWLTRAKSTTTFPPRKWATC
jgi:hypothetical protein